MALTVDEFAQRVKQKYPQYQNMDNADLTKRMVEKYPQYKTAIDRTEFSGAPIADKVTKALGGGFIGKAAGFAVGLPERAIRTTLGVKNAGNLALTSLVGSDEVKRTSREKLLKGDIPFLSNYQEDLLRGGNTAKDQASLALGGLQYGSDLASLIPSGALASEGKNITSLVPTSLDSAAGRYAALGAKEGLIGSIGNIDRAPTPEEIVTGTALGGAVGFAGGKLSELKVNNKTLGKIKVTPEEQANISRFNKELKDTPMFIQNFKTNEARQVPNDLKGTVYYLDSIGKNGDWHVTTSENAVNGLKVGGWKVGKPADASLINSLSTETSKSGSAKLGRTAIEELRNSTEGFQDFALRKGKNVEDTVQRLTQASDEFGLRGSNINKIKLADAKMAEIENSIIQPEVSASKAMVSVDELTSKLRDEMKDSFVIRDTASQNDAFDNITRILKDKSKDGVLTTRDVLEVRRAISKSLSRVYGKLEKGTPLTGIEEIMLDTTTALNKVIGDMAPNVREATMKQSLLFDIKEALASKVNKSPLSIPFGTGRLGLPARASQAIVSEGTRYGQGVGASAGKAALAVGEGASKLTPALSRISGGLSAASDQGQPMPEPQTNEQPTLSPGGQWKWDAQANDWVPNQQQTQRGGSLRYTPEQIAQAMQMDLVNNNGSNYGTLAKLYEIAVAEEKRTTAEEPKAKKLTDKQRSFVGAGAIAKEVLDILESAPDKTSVGPVAGRLSAFGQVLGTETPEQTQIKSKIASARTAARNALIGATMSDKELESYLDATFDINLPRKVLLERVRSFISDMNTLSMANTETPENTQ